MSALTISTIPVPVAPGVRAAQPRRRARALTAVPAAPTRPASAPAAARHLRLTRRGRLTITLAMAGMLAVLGVAGATSASAGPTVDAPAATRQLVVLPGETLWSIAAEVDPTADRRDLIADIVRMNDLSTSRVMSGQTLVVPTG